MLVYVIADALATVVSLAFSFLPKITTLPMIFGFDIDTALVNGVGMLYSFIASVWPIQVVFQGFLFLLGYYVIKIVARVFLGSRVPVAQ